MKVYRVSWTGGVAVVVAHNCLAAMLTTPNPEEANAELIGAALRTVSAGVICSTAWQGDDEASLQEQWRKNA